MPTHGSRSGGGATRSAQPKLQVIGPKHRPRLTSRRSRFRGCARASEAYAASDVTVAPAGVSVRLLYPYAAVLRREGVAEETLLRASGLAESLFHDPNARVSYEACGRFLSAAIANTKHRALGLEAAKHQDAAQFQLLEFFVASSARVETAIDDLVRYQSVLTDSRVLTIEHRDDDVLLRYAPPYSPPRVVVEYVLGGLALGAARSLSSASLMRRMSENPVASVCFACSVPAAVREEYARFFGRAVRYDAEYNGILISRELARRKNLRANPNAHGMLESQVCSHDREGGAVRSFSDRVRAIISRGLEQADVGQERIARALHVSRTTLKRRLAAEGTHSRALIAEVRRAAALRALQQPGLSVREVALRAGYEDATAFNKAFKRWTGLSPAEYRARSKW